MTFGLKEKEKGRKRKESEGRKRIKGRKREGEQEGGEEKDKTYVSVFYFPASTLKGSPCICIHCLFTGMFYRY